MSADVFISYARGASAEEAEALQRALAAVHIDAFFDKSDIPTGGAYPEYLADALCGSRVVIVFAHASYFLRPWCVYEFRVATAPYRADATYSRQHLIFALPAGDAQALVDRLPPALAEASWPAASDSTALAALIEQRLAGIKEPLSSVLDQLDDDAVRALRNGALVPAATAAHPGHILRGRMPASLLERFVGRTDMLWRILDALDPRGASAALRSCAVQGGGGMGKTQLTAEFVARYAARHYPDGFVWIDAGGGDDDLATQLHGVLRVFVPGSPALESFGELPSDRLEAVSAALDPAIAPGLRLLWVVDNIPEPGPQRPSQPVRRWCPVRHKVSLLCTSRRAGIKDVDAHIQLRELPIDAALELLTQPPVKRAWLGDADWRAVAQWLGCWPLGLRLAQASLGDGFVRADQLLAKARGDEPATALEAEVEALGEEVGAEYARGVAEVFRASYAGLAAKPQACFAAHLLSRLARAPLPETLLEGLAPSTALGVLAQRSWIVAGESADAAARRTWEMHAVVASYLRQVSADPALRAPDVGPQRELDALCAWLADLFAGTPPYRQLKRHFRVVLNGLTDVLTREPHPLLADRAGRLALTVATWKLEDFEAREMRFYAARLATLLGLDTELARRLRAAASANEDAARSALAAASGMSDSPEAVDLLIEHMEDPRDFVRWQVYPSATKLTRTDLLARPLLSAILHEPTESVLANAAVEFEPFLADRSTLPEVLDETDAALESGDPPHRRAAAMILGRTLHVHGRELDAGSWTGLRVSRTLLRAALKDEDDAVAEECARALSWTDEPELYGVLNTAIAQTAPAPRWQRAVDVMVRCVLARERPSSPRGYWQESDGESAMLIQWPKSGQRAVELLAPLAQLALAGGDAVREHTTAALCGRLFGRMPTAEHEDYLVLGGHDCILVRAVVRGEPSTTSRGALAKAVMAALDRGEHAAVAAVAAVAIGVDPKFASPYWWRGQVSEAQGDVAAALSDYDRVIELMPAFAEAWFRRGELRFGGDDRAGARADYEEAIAHEPKHEGARFRRARMRLEDGDGAAALEDIDIAIAAMPDYGPSHEIRAGALARLRRWADSIAAASRAIELMPQLFDAWYYRAVAQGNLGRYQSALADAQQAAALQPADPRFPELEALLRRQIDER